MKILKCAAVAVALALVNPIPAHAKATVTGGPYTNLTPTGQVITLKLTNYPTNSGFYIIECARSNESVRPKLCNSASQLWVSNSAGASFLPTADIQFRPTATFTYGTTAIDCLKTQCGIFIRLDHMATADTSEDQFIPISFIGGITPSLPSDVISALIDHRVLKSDEALKVHFGDSFTVVATARSGAALTMSTTSTGCTVSGTTLRIIRGYGYCDLTISSPGSAQFAPAVKHYSFRLLPAEQKLTVSMNVRVGTTITLPALTNMGAKVTYDNSSTGNCELVANQGAYSLTFKKVGACRIRATAPALQDSYEALKQTMSFKIR